MQLRPYRATDVVVGDQVVAAAEVIVCAGSYLSPLLLRRSGIDLPSLGTNLADHPAVSVDLSYVWTYHHPVGTCAMGQAVDPDCRVVGVTGLAVVDASGMPEITSANTNLPTIMIAEHVAARRAQR